jgi:hypothetical protein
MHRPYKLTTMEPARVTQEMRVVVAPDPGAPAGSYRRVQIVVPTEPKLYGGIDKDPHVLGVNRSYKLGALAPGALIEFNILPQQWIILSAHEGFADVTVITEYREHVQ